MDHSTENNAAPLSTMSPPLDEEIRPTISVVIPCYNAEAFIEETIRSALNQTTPPGEILVINDGSTDDSAAIAASISPKVRVISQENQGESVARNRGFEEAKGDWIAFLDADDLWEPTKLEEQVKLIANDVVCIHTAYYRFGARSGIVNRSNVPSPRRYSLEFLAVNGFVNSSSILIRKSVRARFPEWTKDGEDLLFFLEISREGRMRMVPKPLVGYRGHASNASSCDDRNIRWHKSIMAWLRDSEVDVVTQNRIKRAWNDRLIIVAASSFLHGRVVESRLVIKYLRTLHIGVGGWIAAPFRFVGERVRYVFCSSQTG